MIKRLSQYKIISLCKLQKKEHDMENSYDKCSLRAITGKHVKNIPFSNSKNHFIYFNNQFTIHPTSKLLF